MIAELGVLDGLTETLRTTAPETSIRLNPAKTAGLTVGGTPVPWAPEGRYLDERPAFTFDPSMYAGRYYVQDASSMVIGEIARRLAATNLATAATLRVLDACAAPGGKTTAILDALPRGAFVLANEYESSRVAALVDNLERWGAPYFAVTNVDARRLGVLGSVFDIVFADVPCSGEGMMRKNETAVGQWSPRLVESCATLQREIVAEVWNTLRPGGYLVYSTCTFNTVENEGNATWIHDTLGAEPVDMHLTEYDGVIGGIGTDLPCARFIPGRIRGEGLFVAVFRKPDTSTDTSKRTQRRAPKKAPGIDTLVGDYLYRTDAGGTTYGVAAQAVDIIDALYDARLRIVIPGVAVATQKGRDMIPAAALATSTALRPGTYPTVEVDYATAVAFLSGEALRLDPVVPRGYIIITYDGATLGFVKNIGNRANNLYPTRRRIRSTHRPDSAPNVIMSGFIN